MGDPKKPQVGDVSIDLSDFRLVDLNNQQISKATKVRAGFEEALKEFQVRSPAFLQRVKVSQDDLNRALQAAEDRKNLTAFVAPLKKLLEMVEETIIAHGNTIGVFLTDAVGSARDRAEREKEGKATASSDSNEDIEASLETAFAYQYGPGLQGAQTKAEKKKEG